MEKRAIKEERIDIFDGRYSVILRSDGDADALRHGEPWPAYEDGIDNLHYALARELIDERARGATIQVTSEGAFREGARAMQKAVIARIDKLVIERIEAKRPKAATAVIECMKPIVGDMPLPTYTPPADKVPEPFSWWSGSNDEFYTNGPFATREQAVGELCGEGGYVVEAARMPVTFSVDQLIEDQYFECDDYFSGENGEPERTGGADVVAAADAELQALLDAWLARWRHTFNQPEMFGRMGPVERIEPESGE